MTTIAPATSRRGYYYGWNIVAACVLSQVAGMGVTLNCYSLFLPGWSSEFSAPISHLSLGMAIFAFGCAVFAPLAGFMADKYPVRRLMAGGLVGIALLQIAVSFATASWQIVAIYAFLLPAGVSFSAAVPAQALVSRWFVRKRGLAMGVCAFGLALAGVIFPPIITALLPQFGWRGVWWMYGALIGLVVAPVVYFTLRERPTAADGFDYVAEEIEAPEAVKLPLRTIFSRPNFWIVVAVFAAIGSTSSAVTVNLAPLVRERGFSLQMAGLLISTGSIAAMASKLLFGMLADRLGNRIPLVLLAAVTALGSALLGVAHNQAALFCAAALIGVAGGVWTILASATAAEFGSRAFGRAYGVISGFTPIPPMIAPLVALAHERTGDYVMPMTTLAVMAAAGGGVALLLNEKRHEPFKT